MTFLCWSSWEAGIWKSCLGMGTEQLSWYRKLCLVERGKCRKVRSVLVSMRFHSSSGYARGLCLKVVWEEKGKQRVSGTVVSLV